MGGSLMRPGVYLAKRRIAAGLSCADVAERLAALPWALRPAMSQDVDRLQAKLEAVERGADLLTRPQIELLRNVFTFDVAIALQLVDREYGGPAATQPAPHLCRSCACSWHDACVTEHGPCAWSLSDSHLCTACERIEAAEAELVPSILHSEHIAALRAERELPAQMAA
jgi:hypothetical protein